MFRSPSSTAPLLAAVLPQIVAALVLQVDAYLVADARLPLVLELWSRLHKLELPEYRPRLHFRTRDVLVEHLHLHFMKIAHDVRKITKGNDTQQKGLTQ